MSFAGNSNAWLSPPFVMRFFYLLLVLFAIACVTAEFSQRYLWLVILSGAFLLVFLPFAGILAPYAVMRAGTFALLWFSSLMLAAGPLFDGLPLLALAPLPCVAVLHYAVANRERGAWTTMRWLLRLSLFGLVLFALYAALEITLFRSTLHDAPRHVYFFEMLLLWGNVPSSIFFALTIPRIFDLTVYNAWPHGEPPLEDVLSIKFRRKSRQATS